MIPVSPVNSRVPAVWTTRIERERLGKKDSPSSSFSLRESEVFGGSGGIGVVAFGGLGI